LCIAASQSRPTFVERDFGSGQRDQGNRGPDQPAGSQRCDQGGTSRGTGAWLRGGRRRGKKLAERTSLSTQEIASTVEKIQSGTRNAVQSMVAGVDQVRSGMALAEQAGASIVEIQTGAQRVVGVVNDITNSLREQNTASTEIARNVEKIATMVEANNASAELAATAAHQLEQLAQGLSTSIGSFRL
jgi:hypothetical protein